MCFHPPPTVHADRCGPQTFSAFLLVISTGITQYNRRVNRMANYMLFIDILFEKIWIFLKRFLVLPKAPSFDIPSVLKFPLPGDKLKHPPPTFLLHQTKNFGKKPLLEKTSPEKISKMLRYFFHANLCITPFEITAEKAGEGMREGCPREAFFLHIARA